MLPPENNITLPPKNYMDYYNNEGAYDINIKTIKFEIKKLFSNKNFVANITTMAPCANVLE